MEETDPVAASTATSSHSSEAMLNPETITQSPKAPIKGKVSKNIYFLCHYVQSPYGPALHTCHLISKIISNPKCIG